ncbi:MAG: glycosyltransferase, partial [Chloroflexi bacterium]
MANDAQPEERELLEKLASDVDDLDVQLLFVPRETLYASWNRGIQQARGDILGFWNVDDVRYPDALIVAHKIFTEQRVELVDCGFILQQGRDIRYVSATFNPESLSPKTIAGPFFLFHRKLYKKAGSFNDYFCIAGDYEWSKRPAVRESVYQLIKTEGGLFRLHGNNLSNNTSPLEWVEWNIILIWHGGFEHLRPVDPVLMRETWESWGHQGGYIPDDVAQWLWG